MPTGSIKPQKVKRCMQLVFMYAGILDTLGTVCMCVHRYACSQVCVFVSMQGMYAYMHFFSVWPLLKRKSAKGG